MTLVGSVGFDFVDALGSAIFFQMLRSVTHLRPKAVNHGRASQDTSALSAVCPTVLLYCDEAPLILASDMSVVKFKVTVISETVTEFRAIRSGGIKPNVVVFWSTISFLLGYHISIELSLVFMCACWGILLYVRAATVVEGTHDHFRDCVQLVG